MEKKELLIGGGLLLLLLAGGAKGGGEPKKRRKIKDLEPGFVAEVNAIARRLETDPRFLLAHMQHESGFDPSITDSFTRERVRRGDKKKNGKKYTLDDGATGLIQFRPSTAKQYGTSPAALRSMTATEQLKYVEAFYENRKGKLNSYEDVYIATLFPAAFGQSDSYLLFSKTGDSDYEGYRKNPGLSKNAYNSNPGYDSNKDGRVTVAEVKKVAKDYFESIYGER